jgi:GNAT superfamily N-acetyltransferase
MKLEVQDVPYIVIKQYLEQHVKDGLPEWEAATLDMDTVTMLLTRGAFARERSAWVVALEGHVVGYAVVDNKMKCLDLLHLSPEVRGKGLSKWFLQHLDIKNVVVDIRNKVALALYKGLGYEIEYA